MVIAASQAFAAYITLRIAMNARYMPRAALRHRSASDLPYRRLTLYVSAYTPVLLFRELAIRLP